MSKYKFNVNNFSIEKDERFFVFAYIDIIDANRIVELLNEQEETIQNQKGYILLLEQKLEENGIQLEPKDFD